MAFKILSQEQIDRLLPRERENYLRAYNEYREREAFVERIERQSRIKVPEYKIKKRGIKRITTPEQRRVRYDGFKPEYGEDRDKLFNTTKRAGERAKRLGAGKRYPGFAAVVPKVAVCKGKDIKAAEVKPQISQMKKVSLASAAEQEFSFRPASVAPMKVKCAQAPELSFMDTIKEYRVKTPDKRFVGKAGTIRMTPPQRREPSLPKVPSGQSKAVNCVFGPPDIRRAQVAAVSALRVGNPEIKGITVKNAEKTVISAKTIGFEPKEYKIKGVKGGIPVADLSAVSVAAPPVPRVELSVPKLRESPVIKFSVSLKKVSLPSVAVPDAARNTANTKIETAALPKVTVPSKTEVKLSAVPAAEIKTLAYTAKAKEITFNPERIVLPKVNLKSAVIAPPVVDETAETDIILEKLG